MVDRPQPPQRRKTATKPAEGVIDEGAAPAAPGPLEARVGYEDGVLMRIKAPGVVVAGKAPRELAITTWRRIGVLTGGHDRLRFFEIEPGDEPNELRFHGFYVRGRFRYVRKLNRTMEARSGFDDFDPE